MEFTEITLHGKRCLAPTQFIKDLKAKEAAVATMMETTDQEIRRKMSARIIRINRKVGATVRYI